MKYVLIFLIGLTLFSCGSDDDSNTFTITIEEIGADRAQISWSIPSQSNNLTIFYRVLINGNEIASDISQRSYLITGLSDETAYTVTVHSLDSEGNGTFAEADFTTERSLSINAVVRLTTQAEVDAFNYTGVHTLELVGSDITNISNLQQLTSIYSRVLISNTSLQNLDGLTNVMSNGAGNKTLRIENNSQLENISGLNQYAEKVVRFYLINNPNISSLNGFLLKPFNNIMIIDNVAVTDFSNFSNILHGGITIKNTPLSSVGGFTGLTYAASLTLNNVSANLTSSFTSLNEINNGLSLENINIQNLSMFSSVQDCSYLSLTNMPQMNSLVGFENNEEFSSLYLSGDTQITDLSLLFANLGYNTYANLTLDNTPFTDLSMLSNITRMSRLSISNTNLITDFTGLDNMQYISSISVNDCPSFTSFEGAQLTFGGGNIGISINNNSNLSDFCGLRQTILSNGIYSDINGIDSYQVSGNAYNPSYAQIITPEGCSL